MKTLKMSDETHRKLTATLGTLMAAESLKWKDELE